MVKSDADSDYTYLNNGLWGNLFILSLKKKT